MTNEKIRRICGTFSTVLILWICTYCGKYRVSTKIVWENMQKDYMNMGKELTNATKASNYKNRFFSM